MTATEKAARLEQGSNYTQLTAPQTSRLSCIRLSPLSRNLSNGPHSSLSPHTDKIHSLPRKQNNKMRFCLNTTAFLVAALHLIDYTTGIALPDTKSPIIKVRDGCTSFIGKMGSSCESMTDAPTLCSINRGATVRRNNALSASTDFRWARRRCLVLCITLADNVSG